MKRLEMLVALLRDISQGLWSHLECSGQNTTIFRCQSIFEDSLEKIISISWLDLRQSVESGLLAQAPFISWVVADNQAYFVLSGIF